VASRTAVSIVSIAARFDHTDMTGGGPHLKRGKSHRGARAPSDLQTARIHQPQWIPCDPKMELLGRLVQVLTILRWEVEVRGAGVMTSINAMMRSGDEGWHRRMLCMYTI
jgi:hypothetical protein